MPNLKTTLGEIKLLEPSNAEWKILCKNLGTTDPNAEVTLLQVLDSNGVQVAYWVLKLWEPKLYRKLLAKVVESVAYLYNKSYPGDDRINNCIKAICDGRCKKKLAAAADAAADACNEALDDDDAAAYFVATSVADAADDDYASASASAAVFAVAASEGEKGREKQWALNEKLMREWIANA